MKLLPLSTFIAATAFSPVLAQSDAVPEGRQLAELSFEMVDTSGRGFIDQGNMEEQRADVFASMDADDNGKLSEEEMLGWGFGFENIAKDTNKELAYNTALRVVFSFWDRNGDGEISETEHRQSLAADFRRADLNNDAILTKEEYLNGFSVLVAIRAALKPVN